MYLKCPSGITHQHLKLVACSPPYSARVGKKENKGGPREEAHFSSESHPPNPQPKVNDKTFTQSVQQDKSHNYIKKES